MSILSWCSRRVGGLSLTTLLILCSWVLWIEIKGKRHDGTTDNAASSLHFTQQTGRPTWRAQSVLPTVLAYYSLFIHVLVTIFPFRACWGIWDVTRNLKRAAGAKKVKKNLTVERKLSSGSISSAKTLTPSTSSAGSSDTEDIDPGFYGDDEQDLNRPYHAILIPNYKEDVEILRETLDVLASHSQARRQYDVYLAMEARESNSDVKAMCLVSDFLKKFRSIEYTMHPADIPGDSPGKSSNISWAARQASERYPTRIRDDVIFTVIDADSHLPSLFFEQLNEMHAKYPETAPTTLYAAPIVFDRNAHLVSALVRIADIQWCAGGNSGLYTGSSIRPPTSVYSLPLSLADKVGGWDSDCEAIGEDLHMYTKCFFALNGHLTSRTIAAPVSQTNVSSGLKGIRGNIGDVEARYRQGLRHMWGCLDSGFALRMVVKIWRERKCRVRVYRPLHASVKQEPLYIPDSELESLLKNQRIDNGAFSNIRHHRLSTPNWVRIVGLCHRLFEAHALPSHMMLLVITTSIYSLLTRNQPDALHLAWTFTLSSYLRLLGFLLVLVYMMLYEPLHDFAVRARESEMKAVGLYEGMDKSSFSHRSVWFNKLDYALFSVAAPLFGSIPAIQAQFSHFWTLDLQYRVSRKPTRTAMPAVKTAESFA